ncbi:dipeptide ABC transporter ATP-binding protein [Elstera cyanobacteriorum]|uniref:dipeptide ABC transporter ATP-binding protein n=1 Tax=Elstera cyanobacteriorum TaxID=2022747 RepID=UPI0023536046|nr:dipeptide ABC transporter ATP-binding protein [Elstera cyanobacteriorum]MCK6441302.1 dipeptide ABC transporter ATP-binding protein [Elstera cyanobacteriorum]
MTDLMKAVDLRRHYSVSRGFLKPTATVKAVDGVSFTLNAGQTLAIVGESGCGKSTLARMLALFEEPSDGELFIDGKPVTQADAATRKRLRQSVQMVFQNPYGSLNPRHTIGKALEEPLAINRPEMSAADRRAAAEAMMAKVGLRPDFYGRYPHMFSGGQRQRIAIARALMLNPRVVVADEPVSALDVSIQAQVLNLLMDLQDELDLAYVFISHDLGVVRHIASDVMVMYLGRPVEYGPVEQIFEDPRHPYTQALLGSRPRLRLAGHAVEDRPKLSGELPSPLNPPSGCAFHKRCPLVQPACSETRPDPVLVGNRTVACPVVLRGEAA